MNELLLQLHDQRQRRIIVEHKNPEAITMADHVVLKHRFGGELDAVGHEPAPVARACSPAYLLGSPELHLASSAY